MKKLAFLFIALFCAAAFAQELPKIAVYVTGDVPNNEKEALRTRILASLVNSGRYMGIERSNAFLVEIEKEHVKQRSGDIDNNQISALGKQFGVKFVCIAAITPAFGEFQVSARIVDVETAVVVYIGESASPLKSMADLASVSDQVVKNMFGGKPTPKPNTEHTTLPPDWKEPKQSNLPTTVASRNKEDNYFTQPDEVWNYKRGDGVASRNKEDSYFTWRYLPIASPVYWSLPAYNVETGLVYSNGMFWGIDFGVAFNFDDDGLESGGGLNIGKSFELMPDFKFVFGGSLGIWGTEGDNSESFNWIGPFIRLRYNIFELSYRVLFGTEEHYDDNRDSYGYYNNNSEPSSSFSAISQVGVGLYLEGTSGRFGQSSYDYYFAFRYLPITSPVYLELLAYDIDAGWVWGDGMSFGIDFGLALKNNNAHIGGGFNFGKSLELPHEFNLALGGSLGFWFTNDGVLFFGPFVRLRYSIFEFSYRALFGKSYDYKRERLSSDIEFSNQVGIGLYFEGKKRHR